MLLDLGCTQCMIFDDISHPLLSFQVNLPRR